MDSSTLTAPPEGLKHSTISSPSAGVLLILISRPQKLNSLSVEASFELDSVIQWFDRERTLRVAIISGVGRAFCVGADLKEWQANNERGIPLTLPAGGFGGVSLRQGKKPIIAAVNGPAFGGGCEMVINCDLVITSASATFSLPEVKRGVTALAGCLPRLIRTVGRQRAADMALTGRILSASEFKEWGVCNIIVDENDNVLEKAVEVATSIARNSPDAVIVTREGLKLGWEALGVSDASRVFHDGWSRRIYAGENTQEGLNAFNEKWRPVWTDSKL